MSATDIEVIDAVEIEAPGTSLVPTAVLTVAPAFDASELVKRLEVIKGAMQTAMVAGVDYGKIPGTDKPTLLKPGAEKLAVLFQLDVQTTFEKDWGPGDHLTVDANAVVFHMPTGLRVGSGAGLCTTREKKYAKRSASRICPLCGAEAIIKGRQEYGGGWLCFAKKGGCGAKWSDGAQEIEGQQVGEIENPDLADQWNTVIKMAKKRALVDAILLTTGASALFTQDVEDQQTPELPEPPKPQAQRKSDTGGRPATAKQRAEIRELASDNGLDAQQLANVVLRASRQPERQFADLDSAERWVDRQIDRLPARLVAPIVEALEGA